MENNLLEKFLQKKLAIKKGIWYYLVDKDGNIVGKPLGNNVKKANDKLLSLGVSSDKTTQDAEPIAKSSDSNSQKLDVKKKFERLLGTIKGISTSNDATDLSIFIYGVDSRDEKHPIIKDCPFTFYWHDFRYFTKMGNKVLDWEVVDKTIPEFAESLTTVRDDTPNESYIKVDELILCFTRKDSYKKKKEEQLLAGKIKELRSYQQKKELANNLSKSANMEEANSLLENEINKDKGEVFTSLMNNGKSKSEAVADISKINISDGFEKINEVYNNAFNDVELKTF